MRFTSLCLTLSTIVATSSLGGQVSSMTWTGSMTSREGTSQLQYRIPSTVGRGSFEIVRTGVPDNKGTIPATNVEFSGTSVRFRATIGSEADCKLDAVPARGYKGACTLAAGDTIGLTLVPPVPSMLLPDHEIMIARDAAPPPLQAGASVFVLGPSGYTEAVRGTNGFTCFIERPTVNDAWPMCHNREAADNLLPVEKYRVALRTAGVSEDAITDSVLRGYRGGRFRAPPSGAMGYMLSRYAWTMHHEDGSQIFLGPHLHIYTPYSTNARVGVDTSQRPVVPMRVEREGRPDASLIVAVKLIPPVASNP
jgi:hypothetical protein